MASVRKRKWTHNGVEKEAWVVSYTDHGGSRRLKTFDKKKDADAARVQIEGELAAKMHLSGSESVTVAKACDLFLKHSELRVRGGDIGQKHHTRTARIVDRYILPRLGTKVISDLTYSDVEAFHAALSAKVNPVTAKAYLTQLKAIEDFCRKRGMTKKAIIKEVCADTSGQQQAIKTFDVEQVKTLLTTVDVRASGHRHRVNMLMRCLVNIAAFCGLRYGEIVALSLDNVDLDRRIIKVRCNLTAADELKGPKTKSGVRDVPAPQGVIDLMKAWVTDYYVENDRCLIFRSSSGGFISHSNFYTHMWKPLLVRAGLAIDNDLFHFHALRHFAASAMIEMGIPLTDVASLMGHSKFDMTLQVYAHPIIGGVRRHEAIDRMSSWLRPNATPVQHIALTN
ncbi:MAG: site-specific integrase [Proteobacteria bacterium]|nr:site-specific integrase [Pseudomonadota bacterium]